MFENLFENPLALIGLVLIPILIILYLLKPKPREFKFPTLMFVTDIEKKEWFRSILKRLIKDPVLLFQILVIALLVFAVAEPFYTTEAEVVSGNVILVIDSSASMLASDVNPNRFSLALDVAIEILKKSSGKFTIVTSSDTWSIQLSEGRNDEAIKILSNLKCDDKPTNIAYSMLLAKDIWKNMDLEENEKKIIYVVSDFAGKDVLENVLESKSRLEQEGIIVILKGIGVDKKNIGIIDADSYRVSENKCLIKFELMNYNEKEENVEILINDNNKNKININSNSIETFSKEINCKDKEKIEVKINPLNADDDLLKTDNAVFIPTPEFKKILFASNDNESKNILNTIPNLKLTEGDETYNFSEFDIVVTDKIFDKNKIADYAKSKGNFIFTAPEAFYKWEYDNLKEILPVEIEMDKAKAKILVKNTKINANIESEEFKDIDFNKYFLEIKKYYAAKNNNATVLAQADDNTVLIAKNAWMFYIGFNSKWTNVNEIPTDISYPALWYILIKSMTKETEINCLCSKRESDIMPGNLSSYEAQFDQLGFEKIKAENKNYIFKYLLILGLIFLLAEMYYLKLRGQV